MVPCFFLINIIPFFCTWVRESDVINVHILFSPCLGIVGIYIYIRSYKRKSNSIFCFIHHFTVNNLRYVIQYSYRENRQVKRKIIIFFFNLFHSYLFISWTICFLKNVENNGDSNQSTKEQKKEKEERRRKMVYKEPNELSMFAKNMRIFLIGQEIRPYLW